MIVITLVSLALAVALIVGLAFSIDQAGVAASSPGVIGMTSVAPDHETLARGVQEGDLPRFVFRDLPWAPPIDASAERGRFGRVPKLALG